MKSKVIFSLLPLCLGLFLSLASLSRASVVLTLDPPGGAITGAAGSTVGWGFTLTSAADFAVITSSNLFDPTLGTYTDFIALNFTIAGPSPESPVVTQAFNANTSSGLGSFTIAAAAPTGAMDVGQIVATYDLYSVDPLASNFDPIADLLSTGNYLTVPASVTVGSPAAAVPEPSYAFVVALLGGIIVAGRNLKKRTQALSSFGKISVTN